MTNGNTVQSFLIDIILAILIATAFVCSGCNGGTDSKRKALKVPDNRYRAVWLYSPYELDNLTIISELKKEAINLVFCSTATVYLSGDSDFRKDYRDKLIELSKLCKEEGISFHAMVMQGFDYGKTENHEAALQELNQLLDFYESHDFLFDGVHIDIEPHALDEWKAADDFNDGVRENLASEYLDLIEKISTQINIRHPKLIFSAASAWWFDLKFRQGVLPSGDITLLIDLLDLNVIMAYSEDVTLVQQAAYSIEKIDTIVGINVSNYKSRKALQKDLDALENEFMDSEFYQGVSYYKYDTLIKL